MYVNDIKFQLSDFEYCTKEISQKNYLLKTIARKTNYGYKNCTIICIVSPELIMIDSKCLRLTEFYDF